MAHTPTHEAYIESLQSPPSAADGATPGLEGEADSGGKGGADGGGDEADGGGGDGEADGGGDGEADGGGGDGEADGGGGDGGPGQVCPVFVGRPAPMPPLHLSASPSNSPYSQL